MVLWKWKQKEWCRNHIKKGACRQGSGIVEVNRQANMLEQNKHSYGVVFHQHRFAAFCELTAVIIEGKQLDHISRNVREVPFRRAQRVSLSRRYGESNQVVLHVSRGCYH